MTSIYSTISKEPQFSKFIKTMIDDGSFIANNRVDRIEAMAEVLNNTLTSVVRLSESVSRQFDEVNTRIQLLESAISQVGSSTSLPKPASQASKSPLPPPPPPSTIYAQEKKPPPQTTRNAIMSELRELFAKSRERKL